MTDIISAAGLIISIAGIYIQLFLPKKKPVYASGSTRLIVAKKAEYGRVKVFYGEDEISCLTMTEVHFWNKGGKVIRERDLLKGSPLKMVISEEIRLLSIEYITTNKINDAFEITCESANSFLINFDSMLKNEGVYFRLLYESHNILKVEFLGDIEGVEKIEHLKNVNYVSTPITKVDLWLEKIDAWFSRFTGLTIFICFGGIALIIPFLSDYHIISRFIFIILCVLCFSITWYAICPNTLPKNLREIRGDIDKYKKVDLQSFISNND